ncbi:MAG: P1 family peptidase [Candidatus Sulfotelmatobacter sp.]
MSPLFEAVIEATEEAVDNSMFRAHDVAGNGHTIKALPLQQTIDLLKKHMAIR